MTLQGVDDRLQTLDLGLENLERIELASLFEDERAKRFNVIGKVGFHEHGSSESAWEGHVNRQSAERSGGVRHARGASPNLPAERQVEPPSHASRRPESPAT